MSYPAYADTKPSGAGWLGDVPENWDVTRLKFVCSRSALYGANESADGYQDFGVRFLRTTDIDDDGNLSNSTPVFLEASKVQDYLLEDGDILLSRSGTIGRAFLYSMVKHGQCAYAGYLVRFSLRKTCLPQFFFYFTKSQNFIGWLSFAVIQSTIGNVNGQKYANVSFGLPQIPEQQQIAAFLDRKTAELDAVLTLKQRQLELLAEKRQALIGQAVTRGLDPSVPLKASGTGWLGDVPEHWEMTRMRYITSSLQTGPFGSQLHSEEYVDDGTPIVNPTNIEAGRIIPNMRCTIDQETLLRLERHVLQEGDIVFGRRGEMGRCGIVTERERGWLCGTGSLRMRFRLSKCWPAYLNFQLSLTGIRDWLTLESVGSTMDNLNTDILARIPVALPPLPEQKAIVVYVDRETVRMDGIAQTIRIQIEKVREYRQALISAAVTGKIDVRDKAGQTR